jgi:ABC-type molybdate transport system permease subunit
MVHISFTRKAIILSTVCTAFPYTHQVHNTYFTQVHSLTEGTGMKETHLRSCVLSFALSSCAIYSKMIYI